MLGKGLAGARRNMVTVGIFSIVVNLLVLAIPIYLFNMSDRVLTSRSTDTLVMLTIIVIIAIAAHVLMDMMRRFILMRVAVETEAKLGGPVLSAAAKSAQSGSSREFQTLADLQHLRAFLTGPVLLTMFDAPVAPAYFAVVFLIHPHLGFIVLGSGVALVVVALLNQRVTAIPFNQANAYGARANLPAESMARNAQVINAMGMIPEGVQVWGRETVESLKAQVIAQDRNILMTGLSKFLRLCTQIGILGWGAWLALESEMYQRHGHCRLDRGEPRAGAAGRHHRRLAQLRPGAFRLRPHQVPVAELAAQHGAAAAAASRRMPQRRAHSLCAAAEQEGDPQRNQLSIEARRIARHRRRFRHRENHAGAHAGRIDHSDRRQRQARHDGPAQLGSAPVRRERRLPAAGRAIVPRNHQGQHRPDARRCPR